ncbi:GPO family capsid scaffolding protein [Pectobacterium aroidearum]|uniref:GPO family capsid scaffolding protein n=1 Tax=Pectobacterium aroidearum TaxID=1201031 RepID=A0ABR5ZEQ3_9GAMM|nr:MULTISPECIES: GPO family capsid scaffolding protein [Pectobacterium]MBA5200042.1 GPO family capsid scaffolding protein [Pectobacterium aroidearum]MBA5228598.1 GPO family capsid scaffolding protein [Pectobacterium aroidearum]MBA5232958.1 GPO family capsid scaffolding protein [Pectobacterium aroidearum]MBA5738120.1 GPO family capsid scaffolding protein [Pectobacterium aroidearum]UXK01057.1 GPO family capsid scaffolding protein [Pectobacterium aroidearum]
MNDSQLTTGWFCVATEGITIDGRYIDPAWLKDMGVTYNPSRYTALIWGEHKRTGDNLGEVLAAKHEVIDGESRLFVRIRPTAQLVSYNEKGQKLFCSIEIEEDFPEAGRFYLSGLAVTDSPASVGTDRIRFSANRAYFSRRGKRARLSQPIPCQFSLSPSGWYSAISGG